MNSWSCCRMLWHTFLSLFEIMYGYIRLMLFKKPMVTIFGGHRLSKQHEQLKKDINEIAYQLVSCDMMIMTGGGGGIMQEAHQGACRAANIKGPSSIGISVKGLGQFRDEITCQDKLYITTHTFFARKWMLMRFSHVFFIFPGGFGTLDEFVEIMTLLKTRKMDKRKIVLYSKKYWKGFLSWAQQEMIDGGFTGPEEMDYFILVDSVDEAVLQLKECCRCV